MKSIKYPAILAGLLSALPLAAAESNAEQYEEVIVTATRSEKPVSEVLSVSTVISREDIARFQSRDIQDLLAREAGVAFTRNGGRGSATSMALRGNQSDHTLFMVDGMRIGSATSGGASLAALNMDLIERVEIVRGPKSAIYGADAIGGVVNLITRTAGKTGNGQSINMSAEYGSNATEDLSAVAALQGDAYSLSLVGAFYDTDGIDGTADKSGVNGDKDGFEEQSLALNYGLALTDNLDLRLSYNRNAATSDYDSNCTDSTTFLPVDCQIYTESLLDSFAASAEYQLSDSVKTVLQLGQSRDEAEEFARNIDINTTFSGGLFNTTKREATLLSLVDLSESETLTVGLDYSVDKVDSSTAYSADSRDNQAAFVQLESGRGPVSLNLGVRYDDNEQFGDATTLSFQAGYDLSDQLRLVASYGEGFKPPSFNDLYYPGFGNPNFVPEESQSVELALQGHMDAARFYLAVYQNDVENLIQYNSVTFVTDQVAEAQIQGLEFDLDWQLPASWQLGLSGSLMDPQDKNTGMQLRRRAEQLGAIDLDRNLEAYGYGVSFRAESHRYDDASESVRLAGYGLVDLRASVELNQDWSIRARVNNLFDKSYTTAYSFSLGEYQSIGRELFLSVNYQL